MSTRRHRSWLRFLVVAAATLTTAADAYAIIGRPLTPVSYAGVARRTTRRAVYGAAAYGAAASYSAPSYAVPVPVPVGAVPALPAGCAPNEPCNGTVYRPTYVGADVVYVP